MTRSLPWIALVLLLALPARLFSQLFDEVLLKDGSLIVGEIKTMAEEVLIIDTAFAGELKVKWTEVAGLKSAKPLPFILKDGTRLVGISEGMREGALVIQSDSLPRPTNLPMESIAAIGEKKPITYKGNLAAGLSLSDGNTHYKTGSIFADFVARSERQRLTLRGAYNYASDEDGLRVRNGKAGIKYDFFITKRFYIFASALFEYDTFQDLDLRTALAIGPGYQFIDKGDFTEEWLREMQLYAEVGIAYFNEDFRRAEDNQYLAGRWAVRLDWPVVPKKITFFHNHEGYPSLEDGEDIYITSEQGVRLAIWNNFVATAQVNYRWDNTPAPGFGRDDILYLFTVGYSFDTW